MFAASNVVAEGLARQAELGLNVPDQVSLVAFDDAPWMSMVTPGVGALTHDRVDRHLSPPALVIGFQGRPRDRLRTVGQRWADQR